MQKTSFVILFVLLTTTAIAQRYQILEDDPYINKAYAGLNFGPNTKSMTMSGIDAQIYVLHGLLNIDARYNGKGIIAGEVFDVYNRYKTDEKDPYNFTSPLGGLKSGYDAEIGFCYNFRHTRQTKKRKVHLFTAGNTSYYKKTEITDIKMSGIRLGFGIYRGILYDHYSSFNSTPNGNSFSDIFSLSSPTDTTHSFNGSFYTNYVIPYLYLGVQSTRVGNYKLSNVLFKQRGGKMDYYADLMFQLHKKISDVINTYSGNIYHFTEVHSSKKSASFPVGCRVGMHLRPARYLKLCYGAEFGILPGYKTTPDTMYGNFDPSVTAALYGKIMFSLGLTYPFKKIEFKE